VRWPTWPGVMTGSSGGENPARTGPST
jgi:hypothetical protein